MVQAESPVTFRPKVYRPDGGHQDFMTFSPSQVGHPGNRAAEGGRASCKPAGRQFGACRVI